MAWRNPRYIVGNLASAAFGASITVTNEDSAFPLEHLTDGFASTLFINSVAGAQTITVDRGSGSLSNISRLFIPPGWGGLVAGWKLEADNDPAFGTPTTLESSGAIPVSSTLAIDKDFTANAERYVRFSSISSVQMTIPQFILGDTITTTRGPEQGWVDEFADNALHTELQSGAFAHLDRGTDPRIIAYRYNQVLDADATTLNALFLHGTVKPLVIDPAYDGQEAIWATITSRSRINEHPSPASVSSARRYSYEFEFREHTA